MWLGLWGGGCLCCSRRSVAPPLFGISWFPRPNQHQIPPNLICHSAPPCPISRGRALPYMMSNVNPLTRPTNQVSPPLGTLLTHLARERVLCVPLQHIWCHPCLLMSALDTSASAHHSYTSPLPHHDLFNLNLINPRLLLSQDRACQALPWWEHLGGRVASQEHTGDKSLLFFLPMPVFLVYQSLVPVSFFLSVALMFQI